MPMLRTNGIGNTIKAMASNKYVMAGAMGAGISLVSDSLMHKDHKLRNAALWGAGSVGLEIGMSRLSPEMSSKIKNAMV